MTYLFLLALIILQAYRGRIPAVIAMIPHYDTIGHTVLLGLGAYLLHRALNRRMFRVGPLQLPLGPALILLVAALEEALQMLSPLRTTSLVDLSADVLGISCAYLLDRLVQRARQTPKSHNRASG